MFTTNDITMVQRWICCRHGKEDQDDYISPIGSGSDNDVGDAVSCLEGAGCEVNKIVGGIMFGVKSNWQWGASKAGGGRQRKRASMIARTFGLLQPLPPLSVPRGGESRTLPSHSVLYAFACRHHTPKPLPITIAAAAGYCIPSLLTHPNFVFDGGGGGGV